MRSCLEELLAMELRSLRLPAAEREYRFCERRWCFDFAWPEQRLAVEVEGGTHRLGRHQRPAGYAADCAKYNRAARDGWILLRFTGEMVRNGMAARAIAAALRSA